MHRDAAGQQANSEEDRRLEHLRRSRAAEVLADVIKVGNDEDSEDRRLGEDQARHRNLTPIRKCPGLRRFKEDWRGSAHASLRSIITAIRIFRMLQVP